MLPNEYAYRELQKINEHLRRENHILRLLDELQHEVKGAYTPADARISRTQDTHIEYAGDESTGNESQGTLAGDVDQKMDVDVPGEKPVDEHKHSGEIVEAEAQNGENDGDGEDDEVEEKNENKKEKENLEKEEEKNEEENDDELSTWISNCTDEDSNEEDEEDEEDEEEVIEEVHIRELHHCNTRAHRNAMLSLFKRDTLGINCSTPSDNLHIELHQGVKGCSSLKPMTLGNCKFDASLYTACDSNPYKRTDVWVYRLLYGLHPAVVLWIDYEPTIRLLEKHAEAKTDPRHHWNPNPEFLGLFDTFIGIFEKEGCLSGYLEDSMDEHNGQGAKATIALAYKKCVDALN